MKHRLIAFSIALLMALVGGCMGPEEENGEVFFTFKGAAISSAKKGVPSGFHVRGHVVDGKFVPEGQILGDGNLKAEGVPGWYEFSNAKFFPFHTAKSPKSPYVHGTMTPQGFVPTSREIH